MSHRSLAHLSFCALLWFAFATSGCASSHHAPPKQRENRPALAQVPDEAAIVHFLQRVTFGIRRADVETVRRDGVVAFLDRQMHPERIGDGPLERRLARLETPALSSRQLATDYFLPAQEARRNAQAAAGNQPVAAPRANANGELVRKERLVLQELSEQKLMRAVYSERQLQEVLADFWFNHFNVFAGKGADRLFVTAYERDVIRPRVFGRFRDLLGATAESPAMLFYLDNWMSVDPDGPHALAGRPGIRGRVFPPRAQQPAGRARRGLNENYARELLELHTLGVDGGYTQRDVQEVARCFTGWTIAQPRQGGSFVFDARQHDPGRKVVMGHVIRPGGGKEDGAAVLDLLSRDPHTARFIAAKLARRFVADDPPASLVDRVAERFRRTDGDLREVYAELFASPEFWSERSYAAKAKTPLEYMASALRATGADVQRATSVVQALRTLGMPLYYCQQPNGYADRADAWMTAGGLLARMNVALALARNDLPGVSITPDSLAGTNALPSARANLVRQLLPQAPSAATAASLADAKSVSELLALTLGSPEFQRR